ncbi:MAG TPA: hypothetical protein VN641_18460 [Urbifossiella sp.]|nr:hypothetical protein [Urbifossiella sp.]
MLEINATDLVFTFPDVDEEAILRVHFCLAESPEARLRIETSSGGSVRLAGEGRFVIYLRPEFARRDHLYRQAQYPFALLVSVGGWNAITGELFPTLSRNPQNYFTTPPQGGIDGYFRDGQVHPFRVVTEAAASQTGLEIRVFPMKSKAFAYLKHQLQLIPGWGPSALRGITLRHGGDRQCEPIYEDICNLGSWDRDHEERVLVWISSNAEPHSWTPNFRQ